MTKRIGIVGHGTLGSYLVRKIDESEDLSVAFVHDVDRRKLSGLPQSLVLNSIEEAKERRADIIVEVASSEWVHEFAHVILKFSNLLIVSVAALAEKGLREKLDTMAKANNTHYYISHGAIVGLDGVRNGKEIIQDVRLQL